VALLTDLKTGAAATLAAAGAGTYRPDGTAYLPGETAIVTGRLRDTPHRQIALATYQIPNGLTGADAVYAIQARLRGLPNEETDADDLVDAVTNALCWVRSVMWGETAIAQVYLQSGTELGTDAQQRTEHTLNFYVQLTRSPAHFPE
jgi:hypothetical protein